MSESTPQAGKPLPPEPEAKQQEEEDYPQEEQNGENHTPEHSNDGDDDPDAPKSFFSPSNLKVAVVPIVGGMLNGYTIGYVSVYTEMNKMGSDCYRYRGGPKACNTLSFADCLWNSADQYCGWSVFTCARVYAEGLPNPLGGTFTHDDAVAHCNADSRCNWSYGDDQCQNPSGYSASDSGIFAGSMILGCMFGAIGGGSVVTKLGSKMSFLLIGIVSLVCSIMYHVACAENEFWVLIVARFVIGIFVGMVGVACPVYVDQNGHPKYKRMIGVLFQMFTTFGIAVIATIALGVGQSVWYSKDKNQHIMGRMQALAGGSTLVAISVIALGIFSSETRAKFNDDDDGEGGAVKLNANEYSWFQMLPRLLMGIVMAGTLQLTGINAVMNYAPTIMGNLGLAPLVGNFVVMIWNFVTTIGSIPLARWFSMRTLFLFGSVFTSCMCMFLCGIPVYPGITTTTAKNGVAITGILLFIMGYEFAVGPCYFVLTQDMFPPSFRPTGCSFTQAWQFIFTVIINVCYPIATEDISGGPSGNQDKGQAIAFIFFGGLGLICFVIQIFFLHPWEEGDAKPEGEEEKGGAESNAAQSQEPANDADEHSPVENKE